jgi:Xaa-Pro aminopeptidase
MSTFQKPVASHDTIPPPNLLSFMLKSWKSGRTKPKPLRNQEFFAKRREELSKKFPGKFLVIPSGHLKVRSNDQHYPFRPSSNFYYLTGCQEPDAVLVMAPEGRAHKATLFVEPNYGKTDATFFTDRIKGELWEGPRVGVEECKVLFGISDCRSLREISAWGLETEKTDPQVEVALSEMRLLKDKAEIKELIFAIEATKRGFEDVICRLKKAKSERELEGVFFTRARMEGNDVGYGSIVASGDHACVLHWKKNNGDIRKGDLLLLDAGIEGNSLYTADITRTLPISGKYTKEQREIYQLVLDAQQAAMKEVKPGNDFMAPNARAMQILAQGLERLKILPTSAEEALKNENQFYKRYTLHNVSHMLGLDVHDCAQARAETYKYGKLEAGMVLTVEPGLYFQPDDLTVPARYRGIGIRIEDDVLVTSNGHKNLSEFIPTEADEISAWMKSLWR